MKQLEIDKTDIIIHYLASETTATENETVEKWIEGSQENMNYFLQLKKLWDQSENNQALNDKYHTKQIWEELSGKINNPIQPGRSRRFYVGLAAAATLMLLIGLGFYLRHYQQTKKVEFSADASIRKITFPDNTHVWLNRKSKITFTKDYRKNRVLELSGEAYFDVTHDSLHPFIIKTHDAIITVLGTKFNVKATSGTSPTEVVVTSGRVELKILGSKSEKGNTIVLTEKEKGVSEGGNSAPVKMESDNPNYLSWKTRDFVFDNTNIRDIVSLANSVYNVNIEIDTLNTSNCNLSGKYKCYSLDEMLEMLQFVLNVTIEKKDNQIRLKTGGC